MLQKANTDKFDYIKMKNTRKVRRMISKGQNTDHKLKAVLLSLLRQKLTTLMQEKILDAKVRQKSGEIEKWPKKKKNDQRWE